MRTTVLCGVLLLTALGLARGQAAQRYPITGDHVAIYNLAGAIRVEGGPAGDVVVEVMRGGSDAAKLAVQTGLIGNRQTLRVVYPDDDIVYPAMGAHSSTTLDVKDDGSFDGEEGRWPGRGHRVRIRGDGSGTKAFADLRVLVPPGRRIAIHLAVGKVTATNVSGDLTLDVSSADVVTSGTRGALTVGAGSGDVRVSDATGDLNLDTGSGDVIVSRVQGDDLSIDTGSGDVTFDHATGRHLKIDTGSGDVRLEVVGGGDSIDIDTGSGDVNLTLPGSYGADVLLDTGSGEINLGGLPVTVRKLEEDHVEGLIGDGKARLHVETGSGDVRLKKA